MSKPEKTKDDTTPDPKDDKKPESKEEDTSGATGDTSESKETNKETKSEIPEDDKKWVDLKKYGVTPEQLVAYAHRGYQEMQKDGKRDEQEDDSKGEDKEGDEEELPVTKAEVKQMKKEMEEMRENLSRDMRIGDAASINQVKLEALCNSDSLLKDDMYAREIVTGNVYKAMANGLTIEQAFAEASEKHRKHLAAANKKANQDKIAANAASGPGAGSTEPETPKLPEFEHKASDFRDGTALKQAMEVVRTLHGG